MFLRYTCPFVEKFSIDIETYYKPDTGNQLDVFNMSSAEKRQRTIGESCTQEHTLCYLCENSQSTLWFHCEQDQESNLQCYVQWKRRQCNVDKYSLRECCSERVSLNTKSHWDEEEICRHIPCRELLHKSHAHLFIHWCSVIVTSVLLIPAADIYISLAFVWFIMIFSPLADPIDIVKDYIPPHEYLAEEDPKLYQSVKTKRGPLSDDWIEEINQNHGESPVMCAYKLCKVEFRYWGMQSKIERFIHDVGRYGRWCVCV